MFQFLKRHIIKAISSLHRGGRRCHFGVVFQVGGESGRTFFAFFTPVSSKHTVALMGVGIGQDDALAARRSVLKSRAEELQSQIGRTEAELQVSERLVSEAEASIGKMEAYLDSLKSQA